MKTLPIRFAALLFLVATGFVSAHGDEPLVAPGAALKIEGRAAFLEGPAWHPSGNVYFSDVDNNRILRRDPKGVFHVFRTPSGRANGLAFDRQSRLVMCEGANEGGNRRVTRLEADGTLTILADRYEGKRFNSPNDLDIDKAGRIYFSDPRYGDRSDMEILDAEGRPVEGVYRIDPDGKVTRVITHEVDRPNGVAVSPEGRWLFVVDNNNSVPDGNRKVWRFDLSSTGDVDVASRKLIWDFGRGRGGDGLAVDAEGRLYVAAGNTVPTPPFESAEAPGGVYIFSPDGEKLGFIAVPEDMVTNCTFGGDDGRTLFITAGHKLWSIPVTTPGL